MSSEPKSFAASATPATTLASLDTSSASESAWTPSMARRAATVSSHHSFCTSQTTMFCATPLRASSSQMARPMPRADPVTRAVFMVGMVEMVGMVGMGRWSEKGGRPARFARVGRGLLHNRDGL